MDEKIKILIQDAVNDLLKKNASNAKIKHIIEKHKLKIHFIPIRYRVLGGILQSMNIQFGNFLEKVMFNIMDNSGDYELHKSINVYDKLHLTLETGRLIDEYITSCQNQNYTETELVNEFNKLVDNMFVNETSQKLSTVKYKHDVDLLFKNKQTGIWFYAECKYNDDHDTGKFVDINRKMLKTYAALIRYLKVNDPAYFKPILFFFTNKKMKGNIYIPENEAIYRGKRFFDTFTNIDYQELDDYMKNMSENDKTLRMFSEIQNNIAKLT